MSASNMIFRLELGKQTVPGINRAQNEDNIGYFFPQEPEVLLLRGQMFMVADGGGGEDGLGEFASKLAVQTVIQEYFEEPWVGTVEEMLTKSFLKANRALIDANIENHAKTRFSISLTCGVLHQESLYLAHIGICRAFLLSNNIFETLTKSHSLDMENRERSISGEGNGKVMVRALGIDEDMKIDLISRKLQINDTILLCTDGVYDNIDEREIQSIITIASPQPGCELIVKQAVANQSPDDVTVMMIKVKSIKRVETDEASITPPVETVEPADRQIVIKGVRYRSTWIEGQIPPEEKVSVTEFSQDRSVRRPIIRRSKTRDRSQMISIRQIFNVITIVAFIAILAFLGIKYIPKYWESRQAASKSKAAADSLARVDDSKMPIAKENEEMEPVQTVPPVFDEIEESPAIEPEQQPEFTDEIKLDVIIIDGSFKRNLTWDSFLKDMKMFSNVDQVNPVKSSYRLQKSKILWRRTDNSEKTNTIQARIDQYQRLFAQYFKVTPEVLPLDLTLVIGANFEVPQLQTNYMDAQAGANVDYYLEVLNGFTVPGLARRVAEQLNQRQMNGKRLSVVDYRNADKKTYRVSFVKCDPSRNGLAAELGKMLDQQLSVVNSQLFDIKVIVGTDIRF